MKRTELIKEFVFGCLLVGICSLLLLFMSVLEETNQLLKESVIGADFSNVESRQLSSISTDSIVTETIIVNPVIEIPAEEYENY